MAKFDLNKMNLGAGLLNETTRQLAQRDLDLVYIPYEKLRVDKRNQYSVDRISELAESISDVGLQQPLNVAAAADGMYDVLGGQRRYLAIGQLREAGNKKYDEVPCTVVNPQNIDRSARCSCRTSGRAPQRAAPQAAPYRRGRADTTPESRCPRRRGTL